MQNGGYPYLLDNTQFTAGAISLNYFFTAKHFDSDDLYTSIPSTCISQTCLGHSHQRGLDNIFLVVDNRSSTYWSDKPSRYEETLIAYVEHLVDNHTVG